MNHVFIETEIAIVLIARESRPEAKLDHNLRNVLHGRIHIEGGQPRSSIL